MIDARYALWTLVIIFGLIGAMRPARKELLVTISIVLALYAVNVLLNKGGQLVSFVPDVKSQVVTEREGVQLQRTALLCGAFLFVVFLGYLGPAIAPGGFSVKGAELRLARAQAGLLGFFLGVVNGFAIVSTVVRYAREQKVFGEGPFPAVAAAAGYYAVPPAGGWDSLIFLRYAPAVVISDGVLVILLVVAFLIVIYAYV